MNSDTFKEVTGVYIAVPCYGMQLYYQCAHSLMAEVMLLRDNGIPAAIEFLGNESHIDRARMYLQACFMGGTEFSHIMFVDSDIEFPRGSILRLLGHSQGVVGGGYPKKGYPLNYAVNLSADASEAAVDTFDEKKLYPVDDLGTGFLMIHRKAFEIMREHYPDCGAEPSAEQLEVFPEELHEPIRHWYTDFFHSGFFPSKRTGKRLFKSEDYAFCRRWGDAGGIVYLDPEIPLNHIGAHKFAGDVGRLITTINEELKNE